MVIQGKPRKDNKAKQSERPSPVSRIDKIASLKRYADKDYALDLLHQMARAVAPLINEYKFKVGTLCEMFPKNANLLGLNVNRGQKILIRLRPSHNDRSFYPMSDLIGTLLHELTHNVHGPHDAKFYGLLDELRRKYETGSFSTKDYVCEENTVGSGYTPPWATPQSVRQKRLEALSKGKFKAEIRKVGGKASLPGDLRKAMLEAAERRLKDSKWCSQSHPEEADVDNDDLEIQELPSKEETSSDTGTKSASPINQSFKEIIDLTREEVGEDEDIEIIAVNACEYSDSTALRKLMPSVLEESTFSTASGHFEMRSTVRYYVSSSPGRTFIGDESSSIRRKVVAELNFDHIIEDSYFTDYQDSDEASGSSSLGKIEVSDTSANKPSKPLETESVLETVTELSNSEKQAVKRKISDLKVEARNSELAKLGANYESADNAASASVSLVSISSQPPLAEKMRSNSKQKKAKKKETSKKAKSTKAEQKPSTVQSQKHDPLRKGKDKDSNKRHRKKVRSVSFHEIFLS